MKEMKSDEQVVGKLEGVVDHLGRPATLSDVTVASSDETVATAAYDTATGDITVKGVVSGTCRVVLSGDASVDAGLQPFEASEDFTILPANVVAGNLVFGAPTPQ